jgi:hypothetical protein
MTRRGVIALGLLVAGCHPPPPSPPPAPPPATRPAPPPPPPRSAAVEDGECRCWHGTSQGNDPSAAGLLYVCRRGARLTGTIRFDSARSGTNVREVSGTYDTVEAGGMLQLHDDRIVKGEAAAGWRFCLVESYKMFVSTATGVLDGNYVSAPCRDNGRLKMSPVSRMRCMFSALRRGATGRDLR